MERRVAEIAADFDALTARDFDSANPDTDGWERLAQLCGEMRAIGDFRAGVPALFRTMERLGDVELGTPGPLVHTLESWRGNYETFLADSVRRKPTTLSVWMVNRILNVKPPNAQGWLSLLRTVAENPVASEEAKAEASRFLKYQAGT
ncbi:MAG TPA: hypothetical protein VGH33_01310 [Isosphaeraceae bacterium]